MSIDDRITARMQRLAWTIRPDVEAGLEATLRRGRRHRTRRVVGGLATGVLAVAGLGLAVLGLVRLAPLGEDRPEAGPSPAITASPGPATSPEADCVSWKDAAPPNIPEITRTCGVVPPFRRVEGGTAYRLRTPAGEAAWLVVGDAAGVSELVAAPSVLVEINGTYTAAQPAMFFEAAPPGELVGRLCGCGRQGLQRVARESLPDGASYERWAVLEIDWYAESVRRDGWTLAVLPARPTQRDLAEQIARGATWTVGPEGLPLLTSLDPSISFPPDWSMVNLHLRSARGSLQGAVTFGCELSKRDPDIGRDDVGPGLSYREHADFGSALWCSNGYVVDVFDVDREEARRLYENIFVTPSLDS